MKGLIGFIATMLVPLLPATTSFAQSDQIVPTGNNPRQVVVEVLLQGFYLPHNDTMQRTQHLSEEALTDRFETPVAERILVELRHKDDYNTLVADRWADLKEDGVATFDLSSDYNGAYYITIKTRNHLETVSASPVCFEGTEPVTYNFTSSAGRAYGNNQACLGNGRYGLFAGDVNQDGYININDLSVTIDQVRMGGMGYLPEDITGNGFVDINDLSPVIDNVRKGIGIKAPP